ncbi:hypothetical protein HDIA_2061 [Hartmannibacter diazotrophicus]|uniref:Zinc-finger protein n=1 Tax=Hartmannibacter diazotrophicus TaxID=1482074 RepID=A0A2C9D5I3_9HYPH|nr:DUF983 domain-containing protein [Hartmannibacter diazotrophicus]SON55602.1 hypothetical protein HDIA_2061 [Hartmannibacter diazotrophicus]
MTIETWKPAAPEDELPKRPLGPAMRSGFLCRCPACGNGRLFRKYLKVVPACEACGENLSHERSDDAAPYFTIVIVGHVIVPLVLMVETAFHPVLWLQMTLWPTLALVMSLALLQPIKGAVVGFQWARYMHGFDPRSQEGDDIPRDPALSVETA